MIRTTLIAMGLLLPVGQVLAGDLVDSWVDSWVVGGHFGIAMGDTSASALNDQLAAQGLNATASSSDDHRTAWQIHLGYQYTPSWGVEFGYVDLGEVQTTISGTTADINTFLTDTSDIHPQTAQGWQLTGLYRQPLEQESWLVLRAGLLDWRSNYRLSSGAVSRRVDSSGLSGTFGIGVEREVAPNTRFGINYGRYNIDGEPISLLSMMISYRLE